MHRQIVIMAEVTIITILIIHGITTIIQTMVITTDTMGIIQAIITIMAITTVTIITIQTITMAIIITIIMVITTIILVTTTTTNQVLTAIAMGICTTS